MSPRRHWQELTSAEIARLDPGCAVVILPVGAIEQHGPHLPLGVDRMIAEGILARALALMPADLPALALPTVSVGYSPEHGDFPGTLSLGAATLGAALVETGEAVARAGLRKLVLLNGHGGQPAILDLAAGELRRKCKMIAMPVNAWRLARRDDLFPPPALRHEIHGGAVETSIMLHLHPDLVRREAIRNFPSAAEAIEKAHPRLAPEGRAAFHWQIQDLNPEGAVGDASLAEAEKGRVLVERAALALLEIIEQLSRLKLQTIR